MTKVGPHRRIEAHRQKELLCAVAFQELEWHAIDDVDFNGVENDIPEITHRPGTPALDNIEPVWTDAWNLTNAHRFLFHFSF